MSAIYGPLSVLGRVLLCTIFFVSAVGNKIPHFQEMAEYMGNSGVPVPSIMLAGAIIFLIAGSVSVVLGYKARFGAALLAIFLILATYYFHWFWNLDGKAREDQEVQLLKNLAAFGAMLFIIANGPGAWSLDGKSEKAPG